MRPPRVFLCHASQDKPAVRELFNALKAEDWIDPWLDKAKILPGQDWEMTIEKAVDDSDVVIICLSNQSVSKEGYVQKEIRYAYDLALEKPEETIFLIPLRLEDCIVPRKLKALHWVDYFGADKDEAYANLLEALRLRYEQKLKAEELERERQEQKRHEAVELSRQLAEEKAAREKAELEARTEREARLKWEREREEAEKTAREKLEREAAEKAKWERVGQVSNPTGSITPKKSQAKSLTYGFWGIGLLALILIGIGLNSLLKNPPVATATDWPTPNSLTLTSVPFTKTPIPTKTAIPTSALRIGSTMTGEHGETLIYVPAGEFRMGSESGEYNEKPVHTVYLDAFWIDQYEVTNKQYQACVDAGMCELPAFLKSYTYPSYYGNPEFDNYPVLYVNWDKANRYCEVWAGGDLPTEAQWEKAARGTDERIYPWGNDVPNKEKLMNYNQNVGDATEVGKYPDGKSPYGVYDMAGNVWEWVNDYYQSNYYAVLGDSVSNPTGPESGNERVLRGGSWYSSDYNVRSAYRYKVSQSNALYIIGFRCARSP